MYVVAIAKHPSRSLDCLYHPTTLFKHNRLPLSYRQDS